MKIIRYTLLCLLAPSFPALADIANAENLVSNGGFESPSFPIGSHYHTPLASLGAWQTTESQFEIWANPPLVVGAIEGTQHLEILDSSAKASIFQSIATTPNQLYSLSFWHSARTGFDSILTVSVDSLVLETFNEQGASAASFDWHEFTTNFVALDFQTTITFTDTAITLPANGAHIDNVRVEVIPEPSTYALLLVGGAASIFALKRRNIRAGSSKQ